MSMQDSAQPSTDTNTTTAHSRIKTPSIWQSFTVLPRCYGVKLLPITLGAVILTSFLPLFAQTEQLTVLPTSTVTAVATSTEQSVSQQPSDYRLFVPIIQGNPIPKRILSTEWDSRLTERGAFLVPALVAPGTGYWRLVKARWYNAEESEGRHHILMDIRDERDQRLTAIPLEVRWRDGFATVVSEEKAGELYATNYAMYALAPAYSAQPADGAPADRVEGMGLGEIDEPYLAYHTSYGLTWRWSIAGSDSSTVNETPEMTVTVPATISATPTFVPTVPGTTAPTAETVTTTATPTFTPISTPTPLSTPTPTATSTSIIVTVTPAATATPTSAPTPSSYPFSATVVTCMPYQHGSIFSGLVSIDDTPVDGYRVTFSYEPDGPPVPQHPAISGSDGTPGHFSHILGAGFQRIGDWYVWIINSEGERISEMAMFHTDGATNQCNEARLNFQGRSQISEGLH